MPHKLSLIAGLVDDIFAISISSVFLKYVIRLGYIRIFMCTEKNVTLKKFAIIQGRLRIRRTFVLQFKTGSRGN